jgi:DNA adenine methylase
MIEPHWNDPRFHLLTREHFYHVGSTEDLRHPMIEALPSPPRTGRGSG